MPKTKTKTRSLAELDEFEPDWFAELLKSLAEPLDSEHVEPASRTSKRTRRWGQIVWEDGYRPPWICGHRTHHNAGRKTRTRK